MGNGQKELAFDFQVSDLFGKRIPCHLQICKLTFFLPFIPNDTILR